MTRDEKLSFIETHHPELYQTLKANVPDLVEGVWHATHDDIENCNAFIAFYCGARLDLELMKKLLF